jgi:hypothetical protein
MTKNMLSHSLCYHPLEAQLSVLSLVVLWKLAIHYPGSSGSNSLLADASKFSTFSWCQKREPPLFSTGKRKKKSKAGPGEVNIWGPHEIHGFSLSPRDIWTVWKRPFVMLLTEPIVLWLSLLSGFSDSLIFTFLQGFQPIYKQWGFGTIQISLAFLPSVIFSYTFRSRPHEFFYFRG